MVLALWFGLTQGQRMFEERFPVGRSQIAGASLAVAAMCLVGALLSLVNVALARWDRAITVDVPGYLRPWLPTISAILVGVLIGTTIFT